MNNIELENIYIIITSSLHHHPYASPNFADITIASIPHNARRKQKQATIKHDSKSNAINKKKQWYTKITAQSTRQNYH